MSDVLMVADCLVQILHCFIGW